MEDDHPIRWFADEIHDIDLSILHAKHGDHRFQTTWEALALLVAIRAWRKGSHSGVKMLIQSDTLSALAAISKASSSSGSIRKILCELALDEADMGSGLSDLMHIPGLSNKWPDALSCRSYCPTGWTAGGSSCTGAPTGVAATFSNTITTMWTAGGATF